MKCKDELLICAHLETECTGNMVDLLLHLLCEVCSTEDCKVYIVRCSFSLSLDVCRGFSDSIEARFTEARAVIVVVGWTRQ